jgi:hypothetical protein
MENFLQEHYIFTCIFLGCVCIIVITLTAWTVTYLINATVENVVDFLCFWKVKAEAIEVPQLEE